MRIVSKICSHISTKYGNFAEKHKKGIILDKNK